MFSSNDDDLNKQISENFIQMYGTLPTGKLLRDYTATLLDLHNHNLITYLYQLGQGDPGTVQLRRRFETMSVRFYIEVKHRTLTIHQERDQKDRSTCHHYYDLEGKISRCSTDNDGISSYNPGRHI